MKSSVLIGLHGSLRLEEFAARYLAYRLESYIDEPEFAELIQESASQIK